MRLVLDFPENKASFMLELLNSFSFVKTEIYSAKKDTTSYLLESAENRERLEESILQLRRGETEIHQLIEA
jgi:hypothetical protein